MVPTGDARLRGEGDDGNTLVGYPIVYDQWTEINGWEGRFLERVAPGAVTKTLKDRNGTLPLLFDHGMDPQIGNKPLGKLSVLESRAYGLYIEAPLDETSYNADLRASLKSGALDGMSFRMTVTRDDTELPDEATDHNPDRLEERTLREIKLFEVSVVMFPAYEATMAGVRGEQAYTIYNQARKVDAAPPGTSTVDTPPTGHLSQEQIARSIRTIDAKLRRVSP
jgi:hypothetical protein